MKTIVKTFIFIAVLVYSLNGFAAEQDPRESMDKAKADVKAATGLEIGGFFDVQVTHPENDPHIFSLGGFEFNLAREFFGKLNVASALVFEDGSFDLAVAFIEVHPYGSAMSARGKSKPSRGMYFQLGKFDLPFGNDWQYFAAPERKTFTAPLTTETAMINWGHGIGFRYLLDFPFFTTTIYSVSNRDIGDGIAFGGRVALLPLNIGKAPSEEQCRHLEFGVSYIHDFDRDMVTREYAFGLDGELSIEFISLRTEFVTRLNSAEDHVHDGFHVTLSFCLEKSVQVPLIIYTRYGFLRERTSPIYQVFASEGDWSHRITAGVNYNFSQVLYIKLEYLQNFTDPGIGTPPPNYDYSGFLQVVMNF